MTDCVPSNATKFTITTRGKWAHRMYNNGGFKTSLISLFDQPPMNAECPSMLGVPGTVKKRILEDRKVHEICVYQEDEHKMKELLMYWKNQNLIDIVSTGETYLRPNLDQFKCLTSDREAHSLGSSGERAHSSQPSSSSSNLGNVERTRYMKVGEYSFPMTEMTERRVVEKIVEYLEKMMSEEKSEKKFISFQLGEKEKVRFVALSFYSAKVTIADEFGKSPDDIEKLFYFYDEERYTVKTEGAFRAMPTPVSVDIVWKT